MTAFRSEREWCVEEACLNAWPSARQLLVDGWLLRASGGQSRRANSVNPLQGGPTDPSAIIEVAEAIYRDLGQPLLFRVVSLVPSMDAPLERRGLEPEGETLTLSADLAGRDLSPDDPDVDLTPSPSPAWMDGRAQAARLTQAQRAIDAAILAALALPARFAAAKSPDGVVAVAFAALHRGHMVIETVGTHPDHRGRGHGRRVVQALLNWGSRAGAERAVLQVAADNNPALALYRSAGFSRELYRYHYRRRVTST